MVKRWKCPNCKTLNCLCRRKDCVLCHNPRPEHPEIIDYIPHVLPRIHKI